MIRLDEKYSYKDFMAMTEKRVLAKFAAAVANEMHSIAQAIKNKQ